MSKLVVKPPGFYGYPEIRKGPDIPYKSNNSKNPVLRGMPLVISSWVIARLSFLQKFLWRNAGFGSLRNITALENYPGRYEGVVIPVSVDPPPPTKTYTEASSFISLPKDIPGRYYSIADFHSLYLSGKVTPLQVAESLIPLVCRDAKPPNIHSIAFIDTRIDLVMAAARASTERYGIGKPLGVLDGVPLAIKDDTSLAGYRTYSGRKKDDKIFEVSSETGWLIQQWEEAGGIIVGKTSMQEVGSDSTGLNPHWGTPRNPFNRHYYTGGSSSGSAYAVATGLLPISLGADAGGSVRIPAANCGIYGLKPSQGRIGDTGFTVGVFGPLASNISDLEVAYRLMATPDPKHPVGSLFAAPRPHIGSRPKILGIYEPWFVRADTAVQVRCRAAIEYMVENLDYKVIDIEIPYVAEGQLAHAVTTLTEMSARLKIQFPGRHWLKDLTPPMKVLATVGHQTPANDYLLCAKMRSLLMSHLAYLFSEHPGLVIATPASPFPAWAIGQEGDLDHGVSDGNSSIRNMEYVWLANLTGCPSISCPVGYVPPEAGKGEDDIPVSLMATGEWGSEDVLIEWGRDLEGYLNEWYDGGRRRPRTWEDVLENARKY